MSSAGADGHGADAEGAEPVVVDITDPVAAPVEPAPLPDFLEMGPGSGRRFYANPAVD